MTMRRATRLVAGGGGFREMQDTEFHPPATVVPFVGAGDPGAVGENRMWLDTGAGGVLWKVRNAGDDGWITVAGQRVRAETTDAYTVAMGDDAHLLRITDAAGATITLPEAGGAGELPIGAQVLFEQAGAGALTFEAAEYVTILAEGNRTETPGQHAVAGAVVVAENTWLLFGNLQEPYVG